MEQREYLFRRKDKEKERRDKRCRMVCVVLELVKTKEKELT